MATKDKQARERRTRIPTGLDYTKMSNQQLHALLCTLIPDMASLPVTWETRETAIRMLQVSEQMEETFRGPEPFLLSTPLAR